MSKMEMAVEMLNRKVHRMTSSMALPIIGLLVGGSGHAEASMIPRTFELRRLQSAALVDRLFVATLHPRTDRLVTLLLRVAPRLGQAPHPQLQGHLSGVEGLPLDPMSIDG